MRLGWDEMGLGKSVVSVMMIIIIITTIKMAPFNYSPTTPTNLTHQPHSPPAT